MDPVSQPPKHNSSTHDAVSGASDSAAKSGAANSIAANSIAANSIAANSIAANMAATSIAAANSAAKRRGTKLATNNDVIQIYYPRSKKAQLREIIAGKEIDFQDYFRRIFDDIIAKHEA